MLEPVLVNAAVAVHAVVSQEVLLLFGVHDGLVTDVEGRTGWSCVHLFLFFICVGCEVDEARWGTMWSTPSP